MAHVLHVVALLLFCCIACCCCCSVWHGKSARAAIAWALLLLLPLQLPYLKSAAYEKLHSCSGVALEHTTHKLAQLVLPLLLSPS
jgi:hypothetical protein